MDIQRQRTLLDEIGGESLEGSGFESEDPAFEEDLEPQADQQEDEQ